MRDYKSPKRDHQSNEEPLPTSEIPNKGKPLQLRVGVVYKCVSKKVHIPQNI